MCRVDCWREEWRNKFAKMGGEGAEGTCLRAVAKEVAWTWTWAWARAWDD